MSTTWFDRRAAQARLGEIDERLAELRREQDMIATLLGAAAAPRPAAPAARPSGAAPKPRGRKPGQAKGPTMAELLVEAAKTNPQKGWTVGELIDVVAKSHPERVSGANASALVSAALAQEAKKASARFTSRRVHGQRARHYKLV